MFDEAYLCEVNLYLVSRELKFMLKAFEDYVCISPEDIYNLTIIKYYYEVAISCHGGY